MNKLIHLSVVLVITHFSQTAWGQSSPIHHSTIRGTEAVILSQVLFESDPSQHSVGAVLLKLTTAKTVATKGQFKVVVENVNCSTSHVNMRFISCILHFPNAQKPDSSATQKINSKDAYILTRFLQSDVAAGTVYYKAKKITCSVDLDELMGGTGGGASCDVEI